jgi:predicted extracellular nuclease
VDDPAVEGDEEFTPTGPNKWTEERLAIKLANLAKVISKMNDGKGPDMLGLAEIENRKVIELLVAKLQPLGRDYKIVHQDSPSGRGIDCGLIYDSKVFELAGSKFHHVDAEATRYIVEAELKSGSDSLFVFVNHWPARSHPESFRVTAGKTLRARIDQILAVDAGADIVAIGDFNDHPTDEGIKTALGTVATAAEVTGGKLLNSSFSTKPDASNGTSGRRCDPSAEPVIFWTDFPCDGDFGSIAGGGGAGEVIGSSILWQHLLLKLAIR